MIFLIELAKTLGIIILCLIAIITITLFLFIGTYVIVAVFKGLFRREE